MPRVSSNPFVSVETLPAEFPGGGSVSGSVVVVGDGVGMIACVDFRAPRGLVNRANIGDAALPLRQRSGRRRLNSPTNSDTGYCWNVAPHSVYASWSRPSDWAKRAKATRDMYQFFPSISATFPLEVFE